MSGATYPPDVALARGLVDEVVEPAALLDRAIAAAQTLAALSPAAFAQTKRQIRQPALERMATATVGAHRRRGHGDLDRAGDARAHPRITSRDVQEGLVPAPEPQRSTPISRR